LLKSFYHENNTENEYSKPNIWANNISMFREKIRKLMVEIKKEHGNQTPLHIFPVMPISCAIEFGRARMPKADMPWILYDQDFKTQVFRKCIELNGDLHGS